MKKATLIFVLCLMAFYSRAQQSKTITAINLQANNSYQFTSGQSPVNSFYGVGGQATVFVKDKIYFGFSQLGSLLPSDLLKSKAISPYSIRMNEYTLNAGFKSRLGAGFYMLGGLRGGLGIISMGSLEKVDGFNEFIPKESNTAYLVAPELKLGLQVSRYFALEAGTTYKKYYGKNENWGISPKDFDGFGGTLSFVGTIPIR